MKESYCGLCGQWQLDHPEFLEAVATVKSLVDQKVFARLAATNPRQKNHPAEGLGWHRRLACAGAGLTPAITEFCSLIFPSVQYNRFGVQFK
jgi:hypothetical protein